MEARCSRASRVAKGAVATAIHLLAEFDRIDYDMPVANYWPAFGVNGTAQISVRRLVLNHAAGIPQVPMGWSVEDLSNWDRTCGGIAGLAPLWLAVPPSRHDDAPRARNFKSAPCTADSIRRRCSSRLVLPDRICPSGISALPVGLPRQCGSSGSQT